ncbi:hypothetical protein MJT46_013778 [Ovis ammon polii x Ovis aries]|nr:hypothetical protein MJT46_013778 [Ovis ammon polii x Ovis aries]
MGEESERPPRNSHGDWPFLRPPERVPVVPVGKNFRSSRRISRGGALHLKRERNSRVVPPFQESPRCVSPFQRNLFSLHCLDVQAEDGLPPRVHVGQPWGKASWESIVGKTRGKTIDPLIHAADCVTLLLPLWGNTSACPHSGRGLTPLGRLQKYPKIHVSTGEESSGSGPDSTQGLRPRHRRERNPEWPPRNSHGDWPFLRPPERVPEGPVGKNFRSSRRISRGGALHLKRERNSRVVPPFQESPRCVSPFQRNLFSLHCLDVQAEDGLPPRVHVGQPWGKASWESIVGKTRGKTIDPLIHAADCVTLLLPLWGNTSACPHSGRGLTPLGRLQKYPKIHVSTGEESSGSGPDSTQGLRPRHRRERNPEWPPRNSHGDWPFLRPPERVPEGPVGKNFRSSRRISRGGALHLKRERNSRVVPPFQESPRCVSPFQRNLFSLHCLDVQAEDGLPPRVHVGQPWGKASWESIVGKTRGKTIDPLIHAADCVTLLLPLWGNTSACPHSGRGLTPLGRLQKYPKIHVSTGEESSGSGPDSTQGLRPRHRRERNPEWPPRNSHGDWPFLRPPERVPEGPVGKNFRSSRRISRGGALHLKRERNSRVVPPFQESPRCVSPFQRNLFSLHCLDVQAEDGLPPRVHVGQPWGKASWESIVGKTRGKTIDPLIHAADCVTLLLPLWGNTSACPHSGRGLTPLGRLQKYPKIHVSTGEESSGSGPDSTQGLRPRHRRERNPEWPPRNSHGDWPFLRPPERVPEGPVGKNFRSSRRISRGGALHLKRERNSRVVPPFQESPRCVSPFQRNLFSLHCLDVQAEDGLPPRVHVGQPWGKASWESIVGKTRGKTIDPLIHAADCVTLLLPLWGNTSACPHSGRGLTPLGRLQKYPKIHVSTGEESSGSGPDSTQGLRPRHRRERNPEWPPRNSHGDWPFLRPPERVPEGPVVSGEHLPQLEKIQEVLPSRRDEALLR